eukprot:7208537-Alexandrium_andersonii.AAC.1
MCSSDPRSESRATRLQHVSRMLPPARAAYSSRHASGLRTRWFWRPWARRNGSVPKHHKGKVQRVLQAARKACVVSLVRATGVRCSAGAFAARARSA